MSPEPATVLEVRHLTKRYGHVVALDDVSFGVRSGEVVGLIGPNGAGKTTLFECLAGVLHRDAGSVVTLGLDDRATGPSPVAFYVPDAIAPWPSATVRWALDYSAGFFGGNAGEIPSLIAALDLSRLLDVPIGLLSKGQRKRAVLAVGLVTRSPLLLIDEPFDGLDLRQTRATGDVLRAQARAGRTLVLSIHQISDAARVCDRFILLDAGRVRGHGTSGELAAQAGLTDPAGLEDIFLALT